MISMKLNLYVQLQMTSISEEAILRKLVADGDGTSEDNRIVNLFQLIGALGNSATDTKRYVSSRNYRTIDNGT